MLDTKIRIIRGLISLIERGNQSAIDQFIDIMKEDYMVLTEFELNNAPDDVKNFITEKGWILYTDEKFGYTPAFDEFRYNLVNLKDYIRFTQYSYSAIQAVSEGNPDFIPDILQDYDYDVFLERLDKIEKYVLYEQALIALVTIFESYLNQALIWIYKNDTIARENLKINLTYGEVLKNWDNLIEAVLSNDIEDFRNFNARKEALKKNKINIFNENYEYAKVIDEAIERRNTQIHNRGRVSKAYNKRMKLSLPIDSKLEIDSEYYNIVENAIENTVKIIDQEIINKYSN